MKNKKEPMKRLIRFWLRPFGFLFGGGAFILFLVVAFIFYFLDKYSDIDFSALTGIAGVGAVIAAILIAAMHLGGYEISQVPIKGKVITNPRPNPKLPEEKLPQKEPDKEDKSNLELAGDIAKGLAELTEPSESETKNVQKPEVREQGIAPPPPVAKCTECGRRFILTAKQQALRVTFTSLELRLNSPRLRCPNCEKHRNNKNMTHSTGTTG